MGYVPNDEERDAFERYLDREGIEDDRDVQAAWHDFCDELEDSSFRSGRSW